MAEKEKRREGNRQGLPSNKASWFDSAAYSLVKFLSKKNAQGPEAPIRPCRHFLPRIKE
jgi:hypothetical protein